MIEFSNNDFTPKYGVRDFRIQADGRLITGALWLPEELQADTPLVLLGHGASGDRYQSPQPYLAKRFRDECGFAVLALDGPVHGLRQQGDGARLAFNAAMQESDVLDKMTSDWHTALDYIKTSEKLGHSKLGFMGLSMGTIFGLPLLASGLHFDTAVIGLYGPSKFTQWVDAGIAEAAKKVKVDLLYLMQLEDELFSREACLEIFDLLPSENKTLHANPGEHSDVPPAEIDLCYEFLKSGLVA